MWSGVVRQQPPRIEGPTAAAVAPHLKGRLSPSSSDIELDLQSETIERSRARV